MKTSGQGNDWLMMTVPLGVTVIIGTVLLGGPTNALEAVNRLVGDVVHQIVALIGAWV